VNCGQAEAAAARVALDALERARLCSKLMDFLPHAERILLITFDLVLIRIDDVVFLLKSPHNIVLENGKRLGGALGQNLNHHEGRQKAVAFDVVENLHNFVLAHLLLASKIAQRTHPQTRILIAVFSARGNDSAVLPALHVVLKNLVVEFEFGIEEEDALFEVVCLGEYQSVRHIVLGLLVFEQGHDFGMQRGDVTLGGRGGSRRGLDFAL